MKRWLVIIALSLIVLSGCERIFTSSLFEFMQRDPATLSAAQRVTYAEDALASGDAATMAAAYDLVSDSDDPETQLLAVELALGASGMASAVTSTVAGLMEDGADQQAVIEAALDGFTDDELAMLVEAAALLDSADDSVTPTAEQYAFTAIGLIAAAAADAGGIDNLDSVAADSDAQAYLDQASTFLDEAQDILMTEGGSTDILDGFTGLIP